MSKKALSLFQDDGTPEKLGGSPGVKSRDKKLRKSKKALSLFQDDGTPEKLGGS